MRILGKVCILLALFLLTVALQGLAFEITDSKVKFTDLQLDKVTARIEVDLKGEGAQSVVISVRSEKRKSEVAAEKVTFSIIGR